MRETQGGVRRSNNRKRRASAGVGRYCWPGRWAAFCCAPAFCCSSQRTGMNCRRLGASAWFCCWSANRSHPSMPLLLVTGWTIAICAPLAVALILRGRAAWVNGIATIWVLVIGTFSPHSGTTDTLGVYAWNSLGIYFWEGAGALGLVIWGLLERQRERINLGVVGFALTVLIFYFSDVLDKLGRSASLIGMGVLLLVGGWIL